jgi:hypothetical protein
MRFCRLSVLSRIRLLILALAVVCPPLAATPLHVLRELEGPGLSVAVTGAGLLRSRSASLTVDVPGTVSFALLVWSGRGPCRTDPATGVCGLGEAPYADQVISFDGASLTGEVAGLELASSEVDRLNVGYMADVTEAVAARGPGRLTFAVVDPDRRNDLLELEGVGLLVAYTDPGVAASYRLMIATGLDFSYGEALARGDEQATQAVSFVHGAAKGARPADLLLFAAGGEAKRPDRIDVSHNDSLVNLLDGAQGPRFDSDRVPLRIPGAVGTTTVQVFSEPWGQNPDSTAWSLAALYLPLPVAAGCTASFWNAEPGAWRGGIHPTQRLGDVFLNNRQQYQSLESATLRLALRFKEGMGLLGAAKALLREGTAALLNAAHPEIEFPLTRTQVLHRVGGALSTQDPAVLVAAAKELAAMNAAGCPLD